jgi:predicted nucleic acid-binding protein
MSVVDASVLVSVSYDRDTFHEQSLAWLQRHIGSGAIIVAPLLVLSEVSGPVARQTGEAQQGYHAIQHLRSLPNLYLVPLDENLAESAGRFAAELRLRGADAVYVALAAQLGLPLISWDREQLERGAARASVMRPDEL